MSIYMSPVEYTLSDPSYDFFADLQAGSNGDPYGDPTSSVGDSSGEQAWAYNTWDSDCTGGFDTGDVPISYDVNGNGDQSLAVGGDTPLTCEGDAEGCITSVTLEAAVQTNAEVSWSNVSIEFLKNGSVVEVVSPTAAPSVNAIDGGSSNVQEQTMVVTPSASDDDQVIVAGTMRMQSPNISYPAAQSMFCNILVNAATNDVTATQGARAATNICQMVAINAAGLVTC